MLPTMPPMAWDAKTWKANEHSQQKRKKRETNIKRIVVASEEFDLSGEIADGPGHETEEDGGG